MSKDPETVDWRQLDDIIECNRQMLKQQVASDVHFLLGDAHARMGAHKYTLISRSHVFAAMFCGPLQECTSGGKDIEIPDVEPAAFQQLLSYIYTGEAELDAHNVLSVLYAAKKYDITGLARACLAFVEDRLDVDNACALLEQAHMYDEREFRTKVLELILRRGEQVLGSEEVGDLCHQCLVDVVGADNLICREIQVFEALDMWAGKECERRGLEMTDDNKRIMLGPALYHARLPVLEPKVFVQMVASRSLLSEEEKVDVMRHFLMPSMRSEHFSSDPRKLEKHRRFNRFEERSPMAWNNKSGQSAISFMTNRDIFLEGFTVYGTCKGGNNKLHVQGRLLDSADNVITSCDADVPTNNKVDIYDVVFNEAKRVTRDTLYTLLADVTGAYTYAGVNGRLTAFDGDVVFTFSSSEKSQTGTCVEKGQLPGLLFTLM